MTVHCVMTVDFFDPSGARKRGVPCVIPLRIQKILKKVPFVQTVCLANNKKKKIGEGLKRNTRQSSTLSRSVDRQIKRSSLFLFPQFRSKLSSQ